MTEKELTKADVARLVRRTVTEQRKGQEPIQKEVAVKPEEVLDFKDYGDHVVVVTTDGKKLRGAKK